MLILFQIIFILFAIVAVTNVFKRRRDGTLGPKGMLFWILFWIAVVIVVVWPNTASMLAARFGIGRGADFVLYISLAILFYLLFRMNVKIEGLSRDLTRVVRRDALDQIQATQSKKNSIADQTASR